jgi:hypothetical protein
MDSFAQVYKQTIPAASTINCLSTVNQNAVASSDLLPAQTGVVSSATLALGGFALGVVLTRAYSLYASHTIFSNSYKQKVEAAKANVVIHPINMDEVRIDIVETNRNGLTNS